MDKLNSMCTTCARLGNGCKGTTCQTWTGASAPSGRGWKLKGGIAIMKRYQIITWDSECGSDERMEFSTMKSARQAARCCLHDFKEYSARKELPFYEYGVAIYDLARHCVRATSGTFPDDVIVPV